MDKFPDDFCWKVGNDRLKKNQEELVKSVRKQFYDVYNKTIEDSDKQILFKFPEKLWNEHRIVITKEIIEKFGKIKISCNAQTHSIAKPVSNLEDIPNNVTSITIDLVLE